MWTPVPWLPEDIFSLQLSYSCLSCLTDAFQSHPYLWMSHCWADEKHSLPILVSRTFTQALEPWLFYVCPKFRLWLCSHSINTEAPVHQISMTTDTSTCQTHHQIKSPGLTLHSWERKKERTRYAFVLCPFSRGSSKVWPLRHPVCFNNSLANRPVWILCAEGPLEWKILTKLNQHPSIPIHKRCSRKYFSTRMVYRFSNKWLISGNLMSSM